MVALGDATALGPGSYQTGDRACPVTSAMGGSRVTTPGTVGSGHEAVKAVRVLARASGRGPRFGTGPAAGEPVQSHDPGEVPRTIDPRRPADPIDCLAMRLHPAGPRALSGLVVAVAVLASCAGGDAGPTPSIRPGTVEAPREVNIIAKDYLFIPAVVDLVPGETVLFHVVNGGLAVHEVVIGTQTVQDAWEIAEAATVDAPPGPTPAVSVSPAAAGLRVVVPSGGREDILYTVPRSDGLIVGCHIPGHYAKGMHVPIRLVTPGG